MRVQAPKISHKKYTLPEVSDKFTTLIEKQDVSTHNTHAPPFLPSSIPRHAPAHAHLSRRVAVPNQRLPHKRRHRPVASPVLCDRVQELDRRLRLATPLCGRAPLRRPRALRAAAAERRECRHRKARARDHKRRGAPSRAILMDEAIATAGAPDYGTSPCATTSSRTPREHSRGTHR